MAKRSRCLNIGAGLKPINLSQPSPDDPEENHMKELAVLLRSLGISIFFCTMVWAAIFTAQIFGLIQLGG